MDINNLFQKSKRRNAHHLGYFNATTILGQKFKGHFFFLISVYFLQLNLLNRSQGFICMCWQSNCANECVCVGVKQKLQLPFTATSSKPLNPPCKIQQRLTASSLISYPLV